MPSDLPVPRFPREPLNPHIAPAQGGDVPSWLTAHGQSLAAGSVLTDWLDSGGDRDTILPFLASWLALHGQNPEAQSVFTAWLKAGGERQTFRSAIKSWLNAHSDDLDASFLFKAWLEAKGKPKPIQNALLAWLSIHGDHDRAAYVLAAWLKARGSFTVVEEVASRWLRSRREDFKAASLISVLARQANLSEETLRDILAWCRRFHQDQEALLRFISLDAHLLREEVASEVVEITKVLVEAALSQESVPRSASSRLSVLFAILSQSSPLREQTTSLLLRWLRHPSSFNPSRSEVIYSPVHLAAQRPSIVFYLRPLIDSGELSVTRDREHLLRFFAWIQTWGTNSLEQVRPLLAEFIRGPRGLASGGT